MTSLSPMSRRTTVSEQCTTITIHAPHTLSYMRTIVTAFPLKTVQRSNLVESEPYLSAKKIPHCTDIDDDDFGAHVPITRRRWVIYDSYIISKYITQAPTGCRNDCNFKLVETIIQGLAHIHLSSFLELYVPRRIRQLHCLYTDHRGYALFQI